MKRDAARDILAEKLVNVFDDIARSSAKRARIGKRIANGSAPTHSRDPSCSPLLAAEAPAAAGQPRC